MASSSKTPNGVPPNGRGADRPFDQAQFERALSQEGAGREAAAVEVGPAISDEQLLRDVLVAWPSARPAQRSLAFFTGWRYVLRLKSDWPERLGKVERRGRSRRRGVIYWEDQQ